MDLDILIENVMNALAAGVIIGPYTPPFQLIHDEQTIQTLGELGVVFLMFSLGLEFSLRKLFKVGALVTISVRRIKFAMASGCPYKAIFATAHRALVAAAADTS